MQDRPYSQASENNKRPILQVLSRVFQRRSRVLEIGAGTGQHSIFFAPALPLLTWQASDRAENIPGIRQWFDQYPASNLPAPLCLDVLDSAWPKDFDAVFTANTVHIMAWPLVERMFEQVSRLLPKEGVFAIYGPFKYRGQYTSESNASFNDWLTEHDPNRGIRDFEKVNEIANKLGLKLLEDNDLPANNRLLVWQKIV